MSKKTSLYRHWNADGDLLYVGISLSALYRLSQHRQNADWYDDISEVTIQHFNSREEALRAERLAIQSECPAHNIKHNQPANDNIPSARPDAIALYIVRTTGTKEFQGILWASERADLWDTFDEFGDPYGYEFAEIKKSGGIIHPTSGIDIKQFSDVGGDEDFAGDEWEIRLHDFRASETFLHDLREMDDLQWETFPPACEKYGLLARVDNAHKQGRLTT